MITKEDVLKVADMSKFKLSDEKVEEYRGQLEKILGIIDALNEVEIKDVAPLYSPLEKSNYFREDIVEDTNLQEKIIASSRCSKEGRIVVPQVVK